ncbi:hypothetical protein [Aquincola sp. J276]|uniref:hypothetical protein n=1 Tax=Aquincola sp. J276 TaxID=2898432 RepID=UPI002150F60F|nr:hypothetical protein [Aquincola sp. J276]MCR5867634.1 hypothetical protein [Aquincola sp. J276]
MSDKRRHRAYPALTDVLSLLEFDGVQSADFCPKIIVRRRNASIAQRHRCYRASVGFGCALAAAKQPAIRLFLHLPASTCIAAAAFCIGSSDDEFGPKIIVSIRTPIP